MDYLTGYIIILYINGGYFTDKKQNLNLNSKFDYTINLCLKFLHMYAASLKPGQ